LRGGFVSVVMQYGNGALQIVVAVILARLLAPEDFGLVAIVTVSTSFASARLGSPPKWVNRYRCEPAAGLAMSAMPPKAEVNSEH